MQILTLDVKIFLQKVWDDLTSFQNQISLVPAGEIFFISQIITEMVEKCNVPNQINIFLREH